MPVRMYARRGCSSWNLLTKLYTPKTSMNNTDTAMHTVPTTNRRRTSLSTKRNRNTK